MKLSELPIGEEATIVEVGGEGGLRQHFLDMGVIPKATIQLMKYAPMGDPLEFKIHGYELTLRKEEAVNITIKDVRQPAEEDFVPEKKIRGGKEHPGLGESGILYHDRKSEQPLPETETLTFALAGNQNSGKTTLFNQLTGSNQHVGNFPGVTVSRKDGQIRKYTNTSVTDLPGIYSMSPYSKEEIVTRQFILGEHPKGIINIVDASNIERNLYLTMQLMELDVPMVLALNMMDEVRENGGAIRISEMEEMMGIPVVPISAAKNEGIEELIEHAVHVAKYQERPKRQDFCDEYEQGGAVHRCLHGIMHLIQDHAARAGIPLRFAASKIAEGDERIEERLELDENEKEMIEHIVSQMEAESGLDRAAAIAAMRFAFIEKVCRDTVVKPKESKEHARSVSIDRVLTGKYTAIPAFIGIMAVVFWLTFSVIGAWLQDLIQMGVDWLSAAVDHGLTAAGVNQVVHGLVIDGAFAGVGSVISFLPLIVILFFFLSMMEDSGYIARVAFVMDKMLRKLGLSGRSIVPMLIGFGCSVPAIMATRTLPSERDRKLTVLLIPFMSCSAKLPIYGFFIAAFFPDHAPLIMISLYLIGIVTGIVVAVVLKKTIFRGEAVPFVMELPNYRLPRMKNVLRLMWDKASEFLQRAFTIIFVATIVIWFLENFDTSFNLVHDSGDSILAVIAGWIAPIFSPMGYGDWRITTALFTGFLAKETVVSTINVLFGAGTIISTVISPLSAMALLVFCLLYTPCVAAVTSVKRELGTRWMFIIIAFQCVIAWLMSLIVYGIGAALGF